MHKDATSHMQYISMKSCHFGCSNPSLFHLLNTRSRRSQPLASFLKKEEHSHRSSLLRRWIGEIHKIPDCSAVGRTFFAVMRGIAQYKFENNPFWCYCRIISIRCRPHMRENDFFKSGAEMELNIL